MSTRMWGQGNNGVTPDNVRVEADNTPHMKVYGRANEYWTEIDFPEFGAQGNFDIGLYNT
jgi:hypothetical protein